MTEQVIFLSDETQTAHLGQALAKTVYAPSIIFLEGELGAGKTTLVRGFLKGLGYTGRVKSPTFSYVESYELNDLTVHHFDFYRVANKHEVEYLGLEEYFKPNTICLIEWPENAISLLPKPSLCCKITVPGDGKGRWVVLQKEEKMQKIEL